MALMAINGTLQTISSKTMAFNEMRLDSSTVKPDMQMFLDTTLANHDVFREMETYMAAIPPPPPPDMSEFTQLIDNLQDKIGVLMLTVDDLPDNGMLEDSMMITLQTEATGVLSANDQTQAFASNMLLDMSSADLIFNQSAVLQNTVSALHQVMYLIEPAIHTSLIFSTNNVVIEFVDLLNNNADLDVKLIQQPMRDASQLTAKIMNLMLTAMHNLNTMTLLNLDEMVYSLTRLTGNVLYFLGPEHFQNYDLTSQISMVLKDMGSTLTDLVTLTKSPRQLDMDDIMQMNHLIHDVNMLIADLTEIMNVELEYEIFHGKNVTHVKVVTWEGGYVYNMNIMGLVVFSIAFGIVLGRMHGHPAKVVVDMFQGINDAVMLLVLVIMW